MFCSPGEFDMHPVRARAKGLDRLAYLILFNLDSVILILLYNKRVGMSSKYEEYLRLTLANGSQHHAR
jgi:hypothetical protein